MKALLVSVMTVAIGCMLACANSATDLSRPDVSKLGPMPLHKSHSEILACIHFTATWCDETWQSGAAFGDEWTREREAALRHLIVQDRVDGMLVDEFWYAPDGHRRLVMSRPPPVPVTLVWDDK